MSAARAARRESSPAPARPLALSPMSRLSFADQISANMSPPIPVMCGSTRVENRGRGHRCIEGVSATLEHRETRGRGERLAGGDHSVRGVDGRPPAMEGLAVGRGAVWPSASPPRVRLAARRWPLRAASRAGGYQPPVPSSGCQPLGVDDGSWTDSILLALRPRELGAVDRVHLGLVQHDPGGGERVRA